FDAVFAEPIDPAAEIHRFAHDNGPNPKLTDQPAAIPAGRERRGHDFVAVTLLAPRFAKRIRLAMHGRVVVLHSAVVAAPQKFSLAIKQSRANRNSAFGKSGLCFTDSRFEQRQIVRLIHLRVLGEFAAPKSWRDGVVEL